MSDMARSDSFGEAADARKMIEIGTRVAYAALGSSFAKCDAEIESNLPMVVMPGTNKSCGRKKKTKGRLNVKSCVSFCGGLRLMMCDGRDFLAKISAEKLKTRATSRVHVIFTHLHHLHNLLLLALH